MAFNAWKAQWCFFPCNVLPTRTRPKWTTPFFIWSDFLLEWNNRNSHLPKHCGRKKVSFSFPDSKILLIGESPYLLNFSSRYPYYIQRRIVWLINNLIFAAKVSSLGHRRAVGDIRVFYRHSHHLCLDKSACIIPPLATPACPLMVSSLRPISNHWNLSLTNKH